MRIAYKTVLFSVNNSSKITKGDVKMSKGIRPDWIERILFVQKI